MSGNYRFTVTGDDGIRVFLNRAKVIDEWQDQGAASYSYTATLTLHLPALFIPSSYSTMRTPVMPCAGFTGAIRDRRTRLFRQANSIQRDNNR